MTSIDHLVQNAVCAGQKESVWCKIYAFFLHFSPIELRHCNCSCCSLTMFTGQVASSLDGTYEDPFLCVWDTRDVLGIITKITFPSGGGVSSRCVGETICMIRKQKVLSRYSTYLACICACGITRDVLGILTNITFLPRRVVCSAGVEVWLLYLIGVTAVF